jgi:MYXO-CTERM domain-containing protein
MRIVFVSLTLAVAAAANADMVVSQQNFNNLALGGISTDATGATAGPSGWYTFGSVATYAQVVADPNAAAHNGGQVLQTQAAATGGSTRFTWNDDVFNTMGSNPSENNVFTMTYDFYMGGASATSTNRYGNYLYDTTGTKILAGCSMQNNTGQFYLLSNYNNAGTVGNFSFSTGVAGILARNTWYTFSMSFNSTTGRTVAGFQAFGAATFTEFFVDGAAAGSVAGEYDLVASVNAAAAGTSTLGFYDNIDAYTSSSVPAPGAIALLALAGLTGRRRR